MTPSPDQILALNTRLCQIIEGKGSALDLIAAATQILPFTAAFAVVNRPERNPIYLADTYPEGAAKAAVQQYVDSTYLLNPIYNAFLSGLKPGLHAMTDLAPDNWHPCTDRTDVMSASDEEIGYRTPGWPAGLQEVSLTVTLPHGFMGEVSFARPVSTGGFTPDVIAGLRPFYPLFTSAFRALWSRKSALAFDAAVSSRPGLEDFATTELSPREGEVVRMILKGHSSQSISLTLGIALPTVKTHRKNAYAKLGISTQQQLFSTFLTWQSSQTGKLESATFPIAPL